MHAWDRLDGRIQGAEVVEPLEGGRIRIGGPGGRTVLGMPPTLLDCRASGEHALAQFDAHGVDAGVLVQEYLDGEQNSYSLSLERRFPDRFFAYALPDFFRAPAEAAAECQRLLDQGFRGLKVCGGQLRGRFEFDDPHFAPVWQRMEREGQALAIDFSDGSAQVPAFARVLANCPQLRAAIGHFGLPTRGGWPEQLLLAQHPNVRIESGGIVWLYREEGYPFPQAQRAIAEARDRVGIEKMMWGSDWPRTMCDFTYAQSLRFVEDSRLLTDGEKAAFLGENARSFYGFKAPATPRQPLTPITAL
jgi:predicted TIM-barrel fold metal-dependent hydrolase